MTMKRVNCELVCHFKRKLLLYMVFSLGLYVESNFKILAEGTAYHRLDELTVQEVCGILSLIVWQGTPYHVSVVSHVV